MQEIEGLQLNGKVSQLVIQFERIIRKNASKEEERASAVNTGKSPPPKESTISLRKVPDKRYKYQHPVSDVQKAYTMDVDSINDRLLKPEQLENFACQSSPSTPDGISTILELLDELDEGRIDLYLPLESTDIEVMGFPHIGSTTVRKESCWMDEEGNNVGKCQQDDVLSSSVRSFGCDTNNNNGTKLSIENKNEKTEIPSNVLKDYPKANIKERKNTLHVRGSRNKSQISKEQHRSAMSMYGATLGMTRRRRWCKMDINKLQRVNSRLKLASSENRPVVEGGWIYELFNTCVIDTFLALQMTILDQYPYVLENYRNGTSPPFVELADLLPLYKEGKHDACRVRWVIISKLEPDLVGNNRKIFNLYRLEGAMVFPAFSGSMEVTGYCQCTSPGGKRRENWEKIFVTRDQNDSADPRHYLQNAVNDFFKRARCPACGHLRIYKLDRPPPCVLINLYPVRGVIKSHHIPDILFISGFRYRLGGVHFNKSGHCTGKLWNACRGLWMYYDNTDGAVFEYNDDPPGSAISIAHYIYAQSFVNL